MLLISSLLNGRVGESAFKTLMESLPFGGYDEEGLRLTLKKAKSPLESHMVLVSNMIVCRIDWSDRL